jgi:hypothetical protein
VIRRVRTSSLVQMLVGASTYVPGVYSLLAKSGGTDSARYCYSVWLRHLVMAHKHGLTDRVPRHVAELGPGDSLGIGLAALLSGVEHYYAFDVIKLTDPERNLRIFDELVSLFARREDIPGTTEFPFVGPRLESYQFPSDILTEAHLQSALAPERISAIRKALASNEPSQVISYVVPWTDPKLFDSTSTNISVDMIYSQAVLEHVDDLKTTYGILYRWLRPGGFMSHDIDFTSHQTHHESYGHWTYSERVWDIIRGKRTFFINRQPHSAHIKLMRDAGFEIVYDAPRQRNTQPSRAALAPEFQSLADDDLRTVSGFVQAVKPRS